MIYINLAQKVKKGEFSSILCVQAFSQRSQHEHEQQRRNNNETKIFEIYREESNLNELLKIFGDGRLLHGSFTTTSFKFDVDRCQATNIWKKNLEAHDNSQPNNLDSGRKGHNGRKRIEIYEPKRKFWKVPFRSRKNIKSLTLALGILKETLQESLENMGIKVHHRKFNPYLT